MTSRITLWGLGFILAALTCGVHAQTFTSGALLFDKAAPSYDYSPSAMTDLDGKEKIWWCSNEADHDVVKYMERIPGQPWSDAVIVFRSNRYIPGATPMDWEGTHTCDPTVVRGQWTVGGQSYGYAMYYTTEKPGTNGQDNRIGVAFSSDGQNWHKWPYAVIEDSDTTAYGTGQSVAWSADAGSGVRTVYTFTDGVGAPHYFYRESSDGINFGARRELSKAGLTLNGNPGISVVHPAIGFAPSSQNGHYYYYMASVCEAYTDSPYGPQYPEFGTAKGVCLYRAEGDDIFNGTWTLMLGSAHVKPMETEPGFTTNIYGYLDKPKVDVYFACSGSGDPNTWELCYSEGNLP